MHHDFCYYCHGLVVIKYVKKYTKIQERGEGSEGDFFVLGSLFKIEKFCSEEQSIPRKEALFRHVIILVYELTITDFGLT